MKQLTEEKLRYLLRYAYTVGFNDRAKFHTMANERTFEDIKILAYNIEEGRETVVKLLMDGV